MTAKQEKFAQEVASGKDQSEAYRIAYNPKKMNSEAIHVEASRLANTPKVSLRIEELKEKHAERAEIKHGITFDSQLMDLERYKILAAEKERYQDSISAVKEQNKMLGFYEKDNEQKKPVNIPVIEWTKPQQ
jgi:phage terminase small subunit